MTSAGFEQSAFAGALLDPESPPPDGLEARHGRPPQRRFAVYRNNVCVGLVDALAERFPVCKQLVGEEFFRAMALRHVREHPPRKPMLFDYGDEFATFVSRFKPARELPYLADVARLEYAIGQAYHAADAAPAPMQALRALPFDRLENATAALHPSTHVVASAYPIVSIWRRHMSDDEMKPLALDHGEEALIVRPELAIAILPLPVGGSAFVHALENGRTFGESVDAASDVANDFDLTACLHQLLSAQAFVAINVAH